MKFNKLYLSLFSVFFLQATVLSASTLLIDGTAPGYINNGSFEGALGSDWLGSGSTLAADLGIQNSVAIRDTASITNLDGSKYLALGRSTSNSLNLGAYLDTGYDLNEGDTFDLSFWYGEHSSLDGDANEQFEWQLFTTTTNDNTGVVDQVIASDIVDGNNSLTLIQKSYAGTGTVTAGMDSQRLFLAFTNNAASFDDFHAVDQVNLSVIPEPSTLILLVSSLVGFALLRRKR